MPAIFQSESREFEDSYSIRPIVTINISSLDGTKDENDLNKPWNLKK